MLVLLWCNRQVGTGTVSLSNSIKQSRIQCCGFMAFWCGSGSGSADPCLWLMDPDPDPAIFVIDLQDANKKLIKKKSFFDYLFWRYINIIFKDKKSKRSHKAVGIKIYLTIFDCWGSGFGSIPLPNGSGSGSRRPKNMWIRWIRIRILIRNTARIIF